MKKLLFSWLWLFVAFVFLFGLRTFRLSELGLHDHDAVMNFLAAKKLSVADFSLLFHHASPFLHNLEALIYSLFKSYIILVYIESTLQLIAILFLCNIFKNHFRLSATAAFFLALFIGSSPLLVYSGRCLTIDNGSLLFIVLSIYFLDKSVLETVFNKNFLFCCLSFGVAFGFNYKSILILPFLFGYLFCQSSIAFFLKKITIFGLINLLFIGFWSLVGFIILGKWTAYLSNLYYLIVEAHQREVSQTAWFEADTLYYFKYIIYFENPLLLFGVGLCFFYILKKFLRRKEHLFEWKEIINQKVVFWSLFSLSIAFPTLFLEKAPRIWITVLIVFYALAAWAFLFGEMINKVGKWLLFFGVFYNLWLCMVHIYAYSSTNYPEAISFLKKELQFKEPLYLKGSLQAVPFLEEKNTNYQIWKENQPQKNCYILTDDYCILADDCLEVESNEKRSYSEKNKYQLLKEWKEPTLSDPFLYLEHSQYLGMNFSKSYQLWQRKSKDTTTIRLYHYQSKSEE